MMLIIYRNRGNCHQRTARKDSNEKPFSWKDLFKKVNACKLYQALKKTVQEESPLPPIELARIYKKNHLGQICKATSQFLPRDAPSGLEPIAIFGDGNCYLRSVLYILYETQERHIDIRV